MHRWITPFVALMLAAACNQQLQNTPSSTPTPTPVGSSAGTLTLVGPFSLLQNECTEIQVSVINNVGDPKPLTSSADISLDAGSGGSFFSDSSCITTVNETTIDSGNSSTTIWVQMSAPGHFDLQAEDAAGDLDPAKLSVSVDALLLAANDASEYEGTFNNAAWTVLEVTPGQPMTASVTVPAEGSWVIEIRARANAREPNGSTWTARLVEAGDGPAAMVDWDVINGNENEYTSANLFYMNNDPAPGATYTYTVELTGTSGGTHRYNPVVTIGPNGDQIAGGRSQIMAIIRPARATF